MNQIDLKSRCAVITGGAAGIGLAIATRLAASGARVAPRRKHRAGRAPVAGTFAVPRVLASS